MPESTLTRPITMDKVHEALNLVTFFQPHLVEEPEPVCRYRRLCGDDGCQYPRYSRQGEPVGLTAHVLVELGLPLEVVKELDREYEIGEVLHPGVKIAKSRNPALARIDSKGMALLTFLQNNQKVGWSWSDIAVKAFRPRLMIRSLDARRRPWLY